MRKKKIYQCFLIICQNWNHTTAENPQINYTSKETGKQKWNSRFYKNDWCEKTKSKPVSIATFNNSFDDFNLALFIPKKDECDTCVGHKTGNIDERISSIRKKKRKLERKKKSTKEIKN